MQQSRGWVHYAIHRPEPHIMLFRWGPCHACCSSFISYHAAEGRSGLRAAQAAQELPAERWRDGTGCRARCGAVIWRACVERPTRAPDRSLCPASQASCWPNAQRSRPQGPACGLLFLPKTDPGPRASSPSGNSPRTRHGNAAPHCVGSDRTSSGRIKQTQAHQLDCLFGDLTAARLPAAVQRP